MGGLDIKGVLQVGVTGLGFLLAFLTYRLLSRAQDLKLEKPHSTHIYVFMGFSLILCVMGLFPQSRTANGMRPQSTQAMAPDPHNVRQFLEAHDPNIFNGLNPENYRIARIFPNKASLDDGGFATILSNTKATLDIAVISGHTLVANESTAIEQAIKKQGAKVRIVIFDVSTQNQRNCNALAQATGRNGCDDLRGESKNVARILKDMHDNVKSGVGGLEVHVYSNVLPYTMWIRDGTDDASKMALVRVHMLRDRANWPSFVVAKDGPELIQNLTMEFDKIWRGSRPLDLDSK